MFERAKRVSFVVLYSALNFHCDHLWTLSNSYSLATATESQPCPAPPHPTHNLPAALYFRLSFIFVFVVSYYICWKKKLGYLLLTIVSVIYFALLCLLLNFISLLIIKYIVCCVISIIGNYCLISIQMKK